MRETSTHRFAPESYPLLIEALHPDTRQVVWSLKVEQPANGDTRIYIPPLARRFGHPVKIRITFADGEVVT